MSIGQQVNTGTVPCPDSQQPIATVVGNRVIVDPIWSRFFHSPSFGALTIGPNTPITPANATTLLPGASSRGMGLDGLDGEDGMMGSPGVQGPTGPPGMMIFLDPPEADEPIIYPGPQGITAPPLGFAGGFTVSTTINDTNTPTTGGATLTSQVAAATAVWRVRAMGQFVAASSLTARNGQVAPFWGSTQLPQIAIAVLASTAQTTSWQCEFIITGSSTTAVWTTGYFTGELASATLLQTVLATPASTTVSAGAQTLDLRFSMSTAVATDQWIVQNVTLERLK